MKLVVLVVGLAIAAAVAWDAGERHYENCVRTAKDRTPTDVTRGDLRGEFEDFTGRTQRRRARALDGCSRLPW